MTNSKCRFAAISAIAFGLCAPSALNAASISVPNGSFELQLADPLFGVSLSVDSWQKNPPPAWFTGGPQDWDQLVGVFKNTASTNADHIDNCDGNQALYVFAVPDTGVFQDYDSLDWAHTNATHSFTPIFEPGKSYHLKLGIIGTGGGMLPGVTFRFGLYYRDAQSNMVTVAATSVTNSPDVFSNNTHFIDFHVDTSVVKVSDAWAGQHIGIQLLSTVDFNLVGGYWDLDNVRLSTGPALLNSAWSNGQFSCNLLSQPGSVFEILTSSNLLSSNWDTLTTVTNVSGFDSFVDAAAAGKQRFYRAHLLP
jgi:hypothetical protein